jgi:hypothetical protein
VICGITYGVIVYLVMNYVVIPVSAIVSRPSKPNVLWITCSVIVHAFLIGLPAALFVRAASPNE